MKKAPRRAGAATVPDMRSEYRLDYGKARPNRSTPFSVQRFGRCRAAERNRGGLANPPAVIRLPINDHFLCLLLERVQHVDHFANFPT